MKANTCYRLTTVTVILVNLEFSLLKVFFQNNFREMTIRNVSLLKLEDLKVLRCSPDLLNNCKTGQGPLQLIMKHILVYHIWGLQPFWSSNLNNLTAQWFLRKGV